MSPSIPTDDGSGPLSKIIGTLTRIIAYANHHSIGLGDVPEVVPRCEKDVDETLEPMAPAMPPLDLVGEPNPPFDWQSFIDTTMFQYTPAFNDDTSTVYSPSQAQSPASSTTLVDSPFALMHNLDLAPVGETPVDQPVAFSPSLFQEFDFTIQREPTLPPLPFPSLSLYQQGYCGNHTYNQGQYWPGQQLSQHAVGVAGAVVPDLATGVEVNANSFAFIPMHPAPFYALPGPFSEPQQGPVVVEEELIRINEKKRSRPDFNLDPTSPAGASNNQVAAPPNKKSKQDAMEWCYPCPYPGCNTPPVPSTSRSTSTPSTLASVPTFAASFGARARSAASTTSCGTTSRCTPTLALPEIRTTSGPERPGPPPNTSLDSRKQA